MTICTCSNCGCVGLIESFQTPQDELCCPDCGCDDISTMSD
jgi:hypothetical protein